MLRLAEKYGDRPVAELPLLFHRITQNAIRDWFRRQKVRSLWTTLLSSLTPNRDDDEQQDPLETLEASDGSNRVAGPGDQLEQSQVLEIIDEEISRLPERQREAFIMSGLTAERHSRSGSRTVRGPSGVNCVLTTSSIIQSPWPRYSARWALVMRRRR